MGRAARVTFVVALVVVDVVLIVWLVTWVGDHRHAAASAAETSTPTSISPAGSLVPTGAVSVVATGGMVLRLTEGTCSGEGRPMLEVSADTGATFNEVAVPVLDADDGTRGPVRTLLAARATSPTEIHVVAGDLACTARGFVTTDGGRTWTEAPYDDWFVDASRESVVGPDDAVEAGCTVRSLSVLSRQDLRVLCEDGTIRGTNDAGETWVVLGGLEDATAAALIAVFDGYGIASRPECASQVMRTDDAGASWTEVGCIDPAATVTNLTGPADALLAATETQTWSSSDGGLTWIPADQDPAAE